MVMSFSNESSLLTASSKVVQLVRPPEGSNVSCTSLENLREALLSKNVESAWLTNEQCAEMRNQVKQPLVFAEFTGGGFERASELGCSRIVTVCSIFGVPSILHYLSSNLVNNISHCSFAYVSRAQPLPNGKPPNFCLSMSNLKITCTNVDRNTRDILHSMIQWMDGDVQRVLTTECRILIAQEVGSKKYHAAVAANIPIVTPRWVLESWKRRHDRNFHASDVSFLNDFKCPAFLGLTITVSGLPLEERTRIRDMICNNGGKFSGALVQNETTHLVTDKPSGIRSMAAFSVSTCNHLGQKYAAASRWVTNKVHIVRSDWLYKSVNKGCCLPEIYFSLASMSGSNRSSTPLRTSRLDQPETYFHHESRRSNENLEYLENLTDGFREETSSVSQGGNASFAQSCHLSALPSSSELYEMSSTLGSFCLPDCKIWVYGFDATLRERLFKIVDFCGAISADGASASTTHLVLNDTVDEKELSLLMKCDFTNCHIVTFRWLVNSFKASARLAEQPFAHPLSQKLKSASTKAQSERVNEFVSQPSANASSPKEAIESILSQYAGQDEPSAVQPSSAGNVNDATSSTMQASKNVTLSTQSMYENVFNGKTFRLLGFNSATLEKLCKDIQRLGGVITPKNPKYLVTPLLTRLPAASDSEVELVSPLWIKNCLASNSIAPLDESPLFRSYYLPESEKPLAGCVLCFSQFHSSERIALSQMAIGAGAKVQDVLSRFSKDNILATTHLILHSPQGDKYRSAIRWKLPCLNTSWLVDCIRCRKRVDPASYTFSSEGQDVSTQAGLNATVSEQKVTKMATPSRPREKRSIADASYNVASTSYRDLNRTYQPKWKFGGTPSLSEELDPKKRIVTSELASALMSAFERVNAQSAFEETNCNSPNEMWSRNIPSSAFKNPLCKPAAGLNECTRQTCSPVKALQPPSDAAVVPLSMEAFPGAQQNVPEGVVTSLYPNLPVFSEQADNVPLMNDTAYAEDEAPAYPSKEDVEMRESLKQRLCTVLQMRSSSEKESLPAVSNADIEPSTSDVERKELDHFEATSDQPPIMHSEYEDVVEAPVDWDDDNQRRAREQIGSLLKEHDQATQSSTSTVDKETPVERCPLFLFTLISEEQRRTFQSVLSRLNVKYALTSSYEPACTHLIAGSLGRTSKVLSAIAKGCWVLHPSFIEACDNANCLVAEEQHEWSLVESKEDDIGARLLAAAVRRWRIRVQAENAVAFQGWNILLLTQKKQKGIVEMLRNGGATVFFDVKDARKGYLAAIDVSSRCCSKSQWRMLVDAGVRCFKLEYIVGFLLDNPFEEKPYQLFEADFADELALS
ncbi:hypothetical protein M514_12830 [Trichuris suis]|uniref:BRCT domain-containing protein n=1 Tax=Trichuris suis TaxID=68888 RepID=A0A085MYB0_9BILA|nr:hypothetical protein M514_12830 [Trichuris suis]